jgi:hypothetical protein
VFPGCLDVNGGLFGLALVLRLPVRAHEFEKGGLSLGGHQASSSFGHQSGSLPPHAEIGGRMKARCPRSWALASLASP